MISLVVEAASCTVAKCAVSVAVAAAVAVFGHAILSSAPCAAVQIALETLGYDPCYHMKEVIDNEARGDAAKWLRAAEGRSQHVRTSWLTAAADEGHSVSTSVACPHASKCFRVCLLIGMQAVADTPNGDCMHVASGGQRHRRGSPPPLQHTTP